MTTRTTVQNGTIALDGLSKQIVEQLQPQAFTVLGWIVPDCAAAARELASHGVTFHRYPWMEQDDLGIWRAPSGAQVVWFADPDGNTLSITQFA